MPNISVVVPTYNSSRTIAQCLSAICNQTPHEVIVVDRYSSDDTAEIAKRYGATVIQSSAGRSAARNIGLKHSSSPGVLFIDSDMILSPTLLEECETTLLDHDALIVPEISRGTGYWAQCKSLERRLYTSDDLMEAARCFRRERILGLGGYDQHLEAGEDWALQNRAIASSLSVGKVKSVIVHDEGHLSLLFLLKKKYGYGKSFGRYLRMYPDVGFIQANPLRRIVRLSMKALAYQPKYGIGILTMTSLEFAAAGLGHLIGDRSHLALE